MKTKSCLFLLTLTIAVISAKTANAQTYQPTNRTPIADNTLGTQVSGNGNNFNITGGVNKGQTLFHSFTDFSVPTNGQANFTNPVGNRDIITRVTGAVFSDINGLVNTNGANFFLINPNGIVFGTNAQLNVGKAFVGSTATSLDLVGGGRTITFGTNPNGDAPLLSISPNILFDVSRLNLGGGNGQINNFGTLQNVTPDRNQYIGLIGGNVNFSGGQIFALGGTVELGGLSQAGTVGFSLDRGVQLPDNITRGNVSLVQVGAVPSIIEVTAGGGGNVRIFAKDIDLQGAGSFIASGIDPGFGSPTAQAGDIKLDATGKVTISAGNIFNQVAAGEIGNGGNIEIKTGNLAMTDRAKLAASTFGQGDAGNIKITATGNISFDGFGSGIGSIVGQEAVGKGGSIEIITGSLNMTNSAALFASTGGQGDAGKVKITAAGNISFDSSSSAFSSVGEGAVGKSGGIEIKTGNLAVTNGAQLTASTFGQGDAGSIKITAAGDILFDDGNAFSNVEQGAVGKGGNIEITTGNLAVTNTAKLGASTEGQGDAGSVKITAAGNILFDGIKNGVSSSASSTVEPGAVGKGGGIEITTGNLTVTNAALLDASTGGQGDAGSIKITATGNILFDGGKDGFNSGAGNVVRQGAVGKGGGLEIKTGNLALTNGGGLLVSTAGQGDAGNIKITATGDISIDGSNNGESSGVFSNISGAVSTRKGGEIEINARNLSITNGGAVTTGSLFGNGNGGSIFINTNKLTLNNDVIIESLSLRGVGGDINITTKDYLLIRNDSSIQTTSLSSDENGNGGNITISSPLIIATPGNNDISANADVGNGGRVNITSQGLFGIGFRPKGQESDFTNDITASSTFGQNGTVNISTPGTDPGKDSNQLPNVPTDASNQISQVCSTNNRQNKLTIAGRGGLPPNANDPLTSDVVWQDTRAASSQPVVSSPTANPVKLLSPAVGWVFDGKGKVTLVAAVTQGQPTVTRVACPPGVGK
jgi:filamentous hemagglutinin family protein